MKRSLTLESTKGLGNWKRQNITELEGNHAKGRRSLTFARVKLRQNNKRASETEFNQSETEAESEKLATEQKESVVSSSPKGTQPLSYRSKNRSDARRLFKKLVSQTAQLASTELTPEVVEAAAILCTLIFDKSLEKEKHVSFELEQESIPDTNSEEQKS